MNDQVQECLLKARNREQEAEGLLHRAMQLTQEAEELRAKAAALIHQLAQESDADATDQL